MTPDVTLAIHRSICAITWQKYIALFLVVAMVLLCGC